MKKIYFGFFLIFWLSINTYAQLGTTKGDALEISQSSGVTTNNILICFII
ncbi:hypothetical protein FHT21_002359 [Pedobacter sp. SG908]|nr:hypothetical protein [Pedobacter sp. SG908]